MARERKKDKSFVKEQQLGKVYQLIEQFEEISRIDLSKLSRLAPATITSLTRKLIDQKLIMEKAVRNTEHRGRPAIGLCVSPFYWQSLCAILTEDRFDMFLCELDGTLIAEQSFHLTLENIANLSTALIDCVECFIRESNCQTERIITFSVAVIGELNEQMEYCYLLGNRILHIDLKRLFQAHFHLPVVITDYFETWLFAESSVGSVIGCENVLFLQLNDRVNLSVLSEGDVFLCNQQAKINVDKLIAPQLCSLQNKLNPRLSEIERYQIINQITNKAIYQLIDLLYPDNQCNDNNEKIRFLCRKIDLQESNALAILHLVTDVTAYLILCLVDMFSPKKVMLDCSLLLAKAHFLSRLNERLSFFHCNVEIVTSRYQWNSPEVLTAAIKQRLYDGSLLEHLSQTH
ncbi:ROK family protein [Avibacterium sp. 21-586]|uniref:ROK family protein n=1 Tax=Avibacterium sp. 21-586 TaxID=2911534 RepID=UPI002248002D|nr:ROK family protein [Avibacterium sp. 21-586]MCW9709688.1 ROK family protein [Avibacterium sp. 21-586]